MSAREKIIAVVGVSEEDTAHLRLLLRKAGPELHYRWRWGGEDGADLVVVDLKTLAGELARNRVQAAGARCALLLDADSTDAAPLVLHRPLKLPTFVAVMRAVEGTVVGGLSLTPVSDEFYFGTDADAPEASASVSMPPPQSGEPGLDELLRHDPDDDRPAHLVPMHLDRDTRVEATGVRTRRSESRSAESSSIDTVRRQPLAPDPDAALPFRRNADEETRGRPLRAYLEESSLLGGPSCIALDGAPPLVLDPKNTVFHADGGLYALIPYCRMPLLRSAWQTLTTAELAQTRERELPQPYERLFWLDALIRSQGRLAAQLDPGGRYRLHRTFDAGEDFPVVARIAEVMCEPLRLHEIAAAAEAAMGDVFDAINAYDAIGCLTWEPRRPRDPAPGPSPRGGFFGRLFGRR
mgnify:CR=1 FL=1